MVYFDIFNYSFEETQFFS